MSAHDLITFWEQKFKNGRLAAILNLSNFGYLSKSKNANSLDHIKQNGKSHTMITHDKFRTNKIQNSRQSAISIFFPRYLGNLA